MSEPVHTSASFTSMAAKRALAIVAAAVGFGLAFDVLFFDKTMGISFFIYVVLTLGGIFTVARRSKVVISQSAYLVSALLLFFSSMLFVRAGGLISFFNVIATLYLLGMLLYLLYKPDLRQLAPVQYLEPVFGIPARGLRRFKETIGELTQVRAMAAKHTGASQVVRGVLLALPVLVVFIILFSSADLIFRKYTTDLLSININGEVVAHIFWITAVSCIFTGVFSYVRRPLGSAADAARQQLAGEAVKPARHRLGLMEATILFGSLNVLFLSFIIVQLTYLFGGEHNITVQGFTYAEYARKGFFELLAVAVLSFVIILGAERLLPRAGRQHSMRFKVLSGALIAQVMVIMISAFKRMALYESAYGFTSLRLYVQIVMVWLAVVFCVLLYKIFVNQRENTFAFLSFVSVMILLVTVNVMNVDAFVARQNIGRYYSTGKLDVGYLGQLPDDAIVETSKLLDVPDSKLQSSLAASLYLKRFYLQSKDKHWQSANLARKAALRALNAHGALLDHNRDAPQGLMITRDSE